MAPAESAAVFLDRDGTLIREVNYLSRADQIEILPGVADALRRLRGRGFKLIVVTNQSVVARGRLSEAELASIHEVLRAKLAHEGAVLDAIYYCPHHPTEGHGRYRVECQCRKPRTGMAEQAIKDFQLNAAASYLVGDQTIDLELAEQIGAKGILIAGGRVPVEPMNSAAVPVVADLLEAAQWIFTDVNQRQKQGEGQ
ncbi:MAG TPA: HAD family hydrolase [Terriglobales bacterium]|jgi:D-glycero-D-manno-heptose 1,7-bisphosphate phosphatase|nr:HAD family hydrolase [Terriglobales bacterium]